VHTQTSAEAAARGFARHFGPGQILRVPLSSRETPDDGAGAINDDLYARRQLPTILVRQAIAGDERAWDALVAQYGGLLRAIARTFRLSEVQAADAAQTTWMRLFENIGKIREPGKLDGWLSSTMRRECIRLFNRQRGEQLTDDVADKWLGHSASPDVAVLLAERNALLWSAVEQLPTSQRQVLLALATDPPPSYELISARLSMAVGSIGPTRQRALRRLRMLLAETGLVEGAAVVSIVDRPTQGRRPARQRGGERPVKDRAADVRRHARPERGSRAVRNGPVEGVR